MFQIIDFFAHPTSVHPYHVVRDLTFASILIFIFYTCLRKYLAKSRCKAEYRVKVPSPEEQDGRLAEFQSKIFREDEPLSSNVDVPSYKGIYRVLSRKGCHVTVQGGVFTDPTECLDLATYDYHSFSTHPITVEVARKTVMAYGVGSCGPRTFYGTVRPHLELEEGLAKFCDTDAASIYSFSYATVSTLLSCFSSRGDYIVCDNQANSAVIGGCILTRCNVSYFEHNNIISLEAHMQDVVAKEGSKKVHRRLVVTEGVFRNTGEICPLPEILGLCNKYRFRLVLEDSFGFGAIGKTGRGTPDYFGLRIADVDVYIGSLSTSLGAVGGFCAGEASMIDFQRLSATAYVFSASLPPYLSASALAALDLIDKDHSYVARLQKNANLVRDCLKRAKVDQNKIALVDSNAEDSPLIVLQVREAYIKQATREIVEEKLQKIVNTVAESNVIILRHHYNTDELTINFPSLLIVAKSEVKESELTEAMTFLRQVLEKEFS